jgi:hypothetical protein
MNQVYFASLDMTVKVALQVMAAQLSPDDRDGAVQALFDDLNRLALAPAHRIGFLTEAGAQTARVGVQLTLPPDAVRPLLRHLSDRLRQNPLDLRCFLQLGQVRLQTQSRHGEELLTLLPAVEHLTPARQLFQARAEAYALRGGEHSPVEQANLELLRYRLDIPPEEAEDIINRVLGPYLDRQDKLQKYRDVLQAEMAQGEPSEATWAELRQLYHNLGLSSQDVAAIEQEQFDRLQAETQQRLQSLETTMPPLEPPDIDPELTATTVPMAEDGAEPVQEPTVPGDMAVTELNATAEAAAAALAQYHQEFQAAIAHSLYPSEFDRGRLEQARRFWQLDPAQVQAVEQAVTAERYGPVESALGLDYTRLRQLLWSQDWRLADQETERLILTGLSQDMQPVDAATWLHLPRVDMKTLDALWRHHSAGQFGFLAQYQAYTRQEGRPDEFLLAVGWRAEVTLGNLTVRTRPQRYSELTFSLEAPKGHLPTWRWGCDTLESEYAISESLVDGVFLHVEKCLPEAERPLGFVREEQP